MKIDLFGPNPLCCFKCQRFGHGKNTCKGYETCLNRCGEEGMTAKVPKRNQCEKIVRVITCNPQNSVLFGKKIIKVKTLDNRPL